MKYQLESFNNKIYQTFDGKWILSVACHIVDLIVFGIQKLNENNWIKAKNDYQTDLWGAQTKQIENPTILQSIKKAVRVARIRYSEP